MTPLTLPSGLLDAVRAQPDNKPAGGLLDDLPGRPPEEQPLDLLEDAEPAEEEVVDVEAVVLPDQPGAPPPDEPEAEQPPAQPSEEPVAEQLLDDPVEPADSEPADSEPETTYTCRPTQGPEAKVRYTPGYTPVLPAGADPLAIQADIKIQAAKGRKWTALEISEQVTRVQELLTSGYRPNLIRQLLQREYGISTPTAEARLRAARNQMVADLNIYDRKEKVAQMVQQLEEVVAKALSNGREANVIGALRLQADLLQLYVNRN